MLCVVWVVVEVATKLVWWEMKQSPTNENLFNECLEGVG